MIAFLGMAGGLMFVIDVGLMKYFTDILGYPPSIYSRLLSTMAVMTIINNILSGVIIDKFANYAKLLKISIPTIAILALCFFFIPTTWNSSIVYIVMIIIMFCYDFAKMLFMSSYMAFILNLSSDPMVRTEIQALRNYLGFIPAAASSLLPMLLFTGNYSSLTISMAFRVVIIIGFSLSLLSLKSVKTGAMANSKKTTTPITLKDILNTFKMIVKVKSFRLYFIAIILMNGVAAVYYSMYMYYMENIALAEGVWAALPDVLGAGVQFIIFGVAAKFVAKIGTRYTLRLGLMVTILCYTGLIFANNYPLITFLYAFSMTGIAVYWSVQLPLLGTIIDLDELETGKRKAGIILAINGIVMAIGLNLTQSLFSYLLEVCNYDGSVTIQTAETLRGLRISIGLIPIIFLSCAILVLTFLPITKNKEKEISTQIQLKHKQEGIEITE